MTSSLPIPRVLIGGKDDHRGDVRESTSLWDSTVVGTWGVCDTADLERAAATAVSGFRSTRTLASFERARILAEVSRKLETHADSIARLITAEVGKPARFARIEVERAVSTFAIASEEAKRIGGEVIPLDLNEASKGRSGFVRRFPVGVVLGISPFNFPLNLVAHKLAPAIASGNAFILKPASSAPLTALALGRLILDAGYPAEAVNVVPCPGRTAQALGEDERVNLVTFTGSAPVGWSLKASAGRKKVVLELGGNAGVIVDATADVDDAVERLAGAAFAYSGQVCIKTQRIFVHESIYETFRDSFVKKAETLPVGDPASDDTIVGPMIDSANADRVDTWIDEAVKQGAVLLTSRRRDGNVVPPAVLENAPPSARVVCEEVFGPVATLHRFSDFSAALTAVNDSAFGLQAGVFTNDLTHAWRAYESLDVGGVIINDTSSYRIDHMPYGGVKGSGSGREGVRYAVESMTEPRLMVLRTL